MNKTTQKRKKDSKKQISWIIAGVILILLVVAVICCLVFKKSDNGSKETASFRYYSGSDSYAIELKGNQQGEMINIDFTEYNGGDQNIRRLTMSSAELIELLSAANEEDCDKQTYDYQCGESTGCSYSTFSVGDTTNGERVCYEVTPQISDFFAKFTSD